jgi:hypothetical protein
MPLNAKGKKILASMEKKYGKKKGKTVFYAMENSGKLKRIKKAYSGDFMTAETSSSMYDSGKAAAQLLNKMAPKGEKLAYINNREAELLKRMGGAGKNINETGIKSYYYDEVGQTMGGTGFQDTSHLTGGSGDGGSNQQTTGSKTTTTKDSGSGGSGPSLTNIGKSLLTMGVSKLFDLPSMGITLASKAIKPIQQALTSKTVKDTANARLSGSFTTKYDYKPTAPNITGGDNTPTQLCPDGTTPPCKTPTTQIKNPVSTPNPFLSGFKAYDDGGEVVISSNVDKDLL